MTRKIDPDDVRNGLERDVLKSLKSFQRKMDYEFDYESEKLEYTLVKNYVPDFIVKRSDDSVLYIESKGYFRPEDRSKLIAIKKQHNDKDIRIIFQRDDRIRRSKSRYSDWAQRHGFVYHIGRDVPKEWLNANH